LKNLVGKKIRKTLAPEGFIIDNFYFIHAPVASDPNLAASILANQKARQDAKTATMQLQISVAEANKSIAQARGDSAVKVINALGEAEAVKKIQQVLSPTYVEYTKIQRWNGKLPDVVGGSGGMMLNIK